MSDPIADLLVRLGMDSTEFSRGAKRAVDDVHTMRTKISSAANVIKGAIGGMIASMAVDRIVDMTKSALEFASSLGEQAQQIGVAVRALQEYRLIATQTGIAQEDMDKALAKLSRTMGAAAGGNEKAADMFKRLGISIRDANGDVRDAGEVIPEIAEAYNKLGSAAEKSALSAEIFGSKLGQKMNPMLAEGAEGINTMRAKFYEMGLIMDEAMIKKADDAADKMGLLQKFLEMKFAVTVADNADKIGDLADDLIKLIGAIGNVRNEWRKLDLTMQQLDVWTAPLGTTSWDERMRASADLQWEKDYIDGDAQRRALAGTRRRQTRRQLSGGSLPSSGVDERYVGGSGSLLNLPKRATGGTAQTPWGPTVQIGGQRRNALASGFGGFDLSSFDAGGAAADWIKAKGAIDGVAASAERTASQSFPQLTAATGKLSDEMKELRDAAQNILDRLFPDQAAERAYLSDMAVLDKAMKKGAISADTHAQAMMRLRHEYSGWADHVADMAGTDVVTMAPWQKSVEDLSDDISDKLPAALGIVRDETEDMRRQWEESWIGMADTALSSLDRLIYGVKSGNFLDTIMGVISLVDSIAGIATGGKGTNILGMNFGSGTGNVRGFATGGSMMLGGMAGIDTNLLSLNGKPIARTTAGETMTITPANARGNGQELTVRAVKGDLFDVIVEQGAARVVRDASGGIARAGANLAIGKLQRRASRMLDA